MKPGIEYTITAALFVLVSAAALIFTSSVVGNEKDNGAMKKLTPEEEMVIVHKGTEPPFSGAFVHNKEKGTYSCKRCGAPLFKSDAKFDSHSGWPSFDDSIHGAVKEIPESDGVETEIVCAKCGAHLGHVFFGEGFTDRDTRHCVNSISLDFEPANSEASLQKAIFAGGCFWGIEYYFAKVEGVVSTTVGYIGGSVPSPSYEQVCEHGTGHAEAVEVAFDPSKTSYEELAKLFFEIHDPTQEDRQGPDIGEQYRSAIFYLDDQQRETALKLIKILRSKGLDVVTDVVKATKFWPAENYHQDYYDKTGGRPYCHVRTKIF